MPDLEGLRPFDGCLSLCTGFPWHHCADDLIRVMDRYGISEALVHDNHARTIYPREHGNRRLCESIEGQSRLHPVWVMEPPKTPGREEAEALVDAMLAAGVHAARLLMTRVPPLPWLWDELCGALESHHIPCFLDFGYASTHGNPGSAEIEGIRSLALAHPEIPLVFSHVMGGLGIHPAIVPLILQTQNVYIDTTGILEFWREVAHKAGPERVLFATGSPFTDPGILVSSVQYARRLDEDAKRLIYGDNLRRLLGNVT